MYCMRMFIGKWLGCGKTFTTTALLFRRSLFFIYAEMCLGICLYLVTYYYVAPAWLKIIDANRMFVKKETC